MYADGTGRDHQRRLQSRRLAGDKPFSRASRPATTIVRDDGTLGRAKSYLACDPAAGRGAGGRIVTLRILDAVGSVSAISRFKPFRR